MAERIYLHGRLDEDTVEPDPSVLEKLIERVQKGREPADIEAELSPQALGSNWYPSVVPYPVQGPASPPADSARRRDLGTAVPAPELGRTVVPNQDDRVDSLKSVHRDLHLTGVD